MLFSFPIIRPHVLEKRSPKLHISTNSKCPMQKKALQTLSHVKYNANSEPLFQNMYIIYVERTIILPTVRVRLVCKYPTCSFAKYVYSQQIHTCTQSHYTSNQYPSLHICKNVILHSGPDVWEELLIPYFVCNMLYISYNTFELTVLK